jgi:hypothetical protein
MTFSESKTSSPTSEFAAAQTLSDENGVFGDLSGKHHSKRQNEIIGVPRASGLADARDNCKLGKDLER